MYRQQRQTNNSSESVFASFYKLFSGLESYMRKSGAKTWLKASKYYELTSQDLLDSIKIHPEVRRAYHIATKQDFCVLKLADGSKLSASHFGKLSNLLESVSIDKYTIYKDSVSEDIHIYIFFDHQIDTRSFIDRLNSWLRTRELPSEIVPDFIEGPLAIPCQSGFAWLNAQGTLIVDRDEVSDLSAVSLFMNDYTANKLDASRILDAIARDLANPKLKPEIDVVQETVADVSESIDSDSLEDELLTQRDKHQAQEDLEEIVADATASDDTNPFSLPLGNRQLSLLEELAENGRAPP